MLNFERKVSLENVARVVRNVKKIEFWCGGLGSHGHLFI